LRKGGVELVSCTPGGQEDGRSSRTWGLRRGFDDTNLWKKVS